MIGSSEAQVLAPPGIHRSPGTRSMWSAIPAALLVVGAIGFPLIGLVGVALQENTIGAHAFREINFIHVRRLISDPFVWVIFARTFRVTAVATLLAVILAYPAAWHLSRSSPRIRRILFLLLMSPLLVSILARLQGWMILLGPNGMIPKALNLLGLSVPPRGLIGTEGAIVVGLLHLLVPFVILNLDVAFRGIDDSWVMAARDLGASGLALFWRVLFPLTLGGLIRAASASFALGVSIYATPALLGSSVRPVVSTLIYQRALITINWPGASILAAILVLLAVLLISGSSWIVSARFEAWRQ